MEKSRALPFLLVIAGVGIGWVAHATFAPRPKWTFQAQSKEMAGAVGFQVFKQNTETGEVFYSTVMALSDGAGPRIIDWTVFPPSAAKASVPANGGTQ